MIDGSTAGWLPHGTAALAFALAVLVLNATPGVDLLLTVSRTLETGARSGLAAALGIGAGCMGHALAAASGLAALLALHPGAFRALQWAGAAYLAWLGVGLLRDALRARAAGPQGHLPVGATPARSLAADFRTGLLTNLLNPKVALFFLAFLPQFVPAASPSKALSFLLLGAWFTAQGTLFLAIVVAAVAALGRGAPRPRLAQALQGAGGMLFMALAARLLGDAPPAPEVSR